MQLLKSQTRKILIEGHRGAEGLALENSWEALEAGYAAKADLLEIDIQRLLDGTLILYNSYQIPDGRWLRNLRFPEIPLFSENNRQLAVLDEVLDWIKDKPVGLSLDIKNGFGFDFQIFLDTLSRVEKHGLINKVVFLGWDHGALLRLKAKNPTVKTRGIIRGYPVDIVGVAKKAQLDALNLDSDMVTEEEIDDLHKQEIAVAIAEIINPNYERAANLGADIICCKDPRLANTTLSSAGLLLEI